MKRYLFPTNLESLNESDEYIVIKALCVKLKKEIKKLKTANKYMSLEWFSMDTDNTKMWYKYMGQLLVR